MSPNEGILGHNYWQSVKEKQEDFSGARAGKWALKVVRPAILSDLNTTPLSPRQLRPTAWLDGLRGFAALLVYFGHHQLWAHDSINPEKVFENTYGYDGQHYLVTLPGIRIFFAGGHFAVSVFFVVSGYVLSARPLQHLHINDQIGLSNNLASSLFRRWLRLFPPVMFVTFIYMCSWHLGVRQDVDPMPTFREELWRWYKEFRHYSYVFGTKEEPGLTYGLHVWSIPTEFKGSLVVYTSLLAFSRSTRDMRLWCTVGLMIYFLYFVDGWYCAMFLMGMLQCDLTMLSANDNLPKILGSSGRLRRPLCILFLIAGVYLGGCPASSPDINVLRNSPGWYYLSYLKPEAIYDFKWFYLFCASSMTVAAIPRLPPLKRFFELRVNQYLGRISFGFYLVHAALLRTVGDRLYAATGMTRASHAMTAPHWINMAPLPNIGPLGLELNYLVPHLVILPITLWAAEVVTKLFDQPSLRFAQWLYRQTLASPEKL